MDEMTHEFLREIKNLQVCAFLTNGVKLQGSVVGIGDKSFLFTNRDGGKQLVLISAVATILHAAA